MDVSLAPFGIQRPERVNYNFSLSENDLINHIKSKSLRSFLLEADEILSRNNIKYEYGDLTEEKFIDWLPYYEEKMEEHNYDVRAKEEWYQEQINKGFTMKGMFFYQDQKLIGSAIFGFQDGIAHFAYKASDRINISPKKGSSLGSIIEFFFLKKSFEGGVCEMATNRSRNAFGFFNTLGYLDLKLRFGYTPRASSDVPLLDYVPVNKEGRVLFFGFQGKEFSLFSLQPESTKGKEWFNQANFISLGVQLKHIYY